MLQLTFGLPFWQCPVPSASSFTVVNAAPLAAKAFGTTNSAAAMAPITAKSLTAVHRWRRAPPESLLIIPLPPSSGRGAQGEVRGRDHGLRYEPACHSRLLSPSRRITCRRHGHR